MNSILRVVRSVSVFLLSTPAALMAANAMTLDEFQDLKIRQAQLLGVDRAVEIFEAMPQERWEIYYDAFPDKVALYQSVEQLDVLTGSRSKQGVAMQAVRAPERTQGAAAWAILAPNYPEASSDYNFYIYDHLVNKEFFQPDDGDAGLQDDRCNDDDWAQWSAGHVLSHLAAIGLQGVCDAAILETNVLLCPEATGEWLIDFAFEEALYMCEGHTGNVDSAEIEATWNAVGTIVDQNNHLSGQIDDNKWIAVAIQDHVEDETNFTDDEELAELHDAMMAEFEVLNARLDSQQEQLDTIIDLLTTPQGRRSGWND